MVGELRVMFASVVEQLLEQDVVVHHGLPQVLGGSAAVGDAPTDLVSLPVAVQLAPVSRRQFWLPPLEVFGGISALGHGGGDQPIGRTYREARRDGELLLDRCPAFGAGLL
ncbi:hypothetical protein ACQEVF_51635 [Nonomuraea polychroma]|uniref:hypothetical protein n=1 Tax=Nonomuraea polychroma TaxID=46176 RepID=UPI003D941FF4